jgi:hypothetical protein
MLPLSMAVPFTDLSSGLDAAAYHTEEAVDVPLEAAEEEWVSASGDGGDRFHRGLRRESISFFPDWG